VCDVWGLCCGMSEPLVSRHVEGTDAPGTDQGKAEAKVEGNSRAPGVIESL